MARCKMNIHQNVTESLVRETYIFESHLGHGASGEVFLVSNRFNNEKYACKVVRRKIALSIMLKV